MTSVDAEVLGSGEQLAGSVATPSDQNWYAVSVRAGLTYQVTLVPQGVASFHVRLVDADGGYAGNVVGLDDWVPWPDRDTGGGAIVGSAGPAQPVPIWAYPDGVYGRSAVDTFRATADGVVYVRVDGIEVDPTTNTSVPAGYTVQLGAADDFGSDLQNVGTLAIGGSVQGSIDCSYDTDDFAVQLTRGVRYEFDTASSHELVVQLLGSDGVAIGGWTTSSLPLVYQATQSGTYYVSVSAYNGQDTGGYSISSRTVGGTTVSPPPSVSAAGPVYRFFDTSDGSHFYTADASEVSALLATQPEMVQEGVGFDAASSGSAGAAPVFRFFDQTDGSHFFTIDASERDELEAHRPDMIYEGVGFYEYAGPQAGATPVYRYFDTVGGEHFFTGNPGEVGAIAAQRPDLVAEGIAFYAPSESGAVGLG